MARAATTSDIFNALGDASRRDILDSLATGEATVGDLVEQLALAQPAVSKHLRVLREVGAVRCRHDGRTRVYAVDGAALRPVETWLSRLTATINTHYDRLDDYLASLQSDAAVVVDDPDGENVEDEFEGEPR